MAPSAVTSSSATAAAVVFRLIASANQWFEFGFGLALQAANSAGRSSLRPVDQVLPAG
jgi:hypothetical protein